MRSKTLNKKPREPTVMLPLLTRQSSGQLTRNNSLRSLRLEPNDRENYSRSQLRAMASAKLQPNKNGRTRNNAERLKPLDPASFNKIRTPQRRALPEPIQAAINGVLAPETLSERGESRDDSSYEAETSIPKVKRTSPCKSQLQSRKPEWNRYIRRIMLTKGIRGSTLARYRRLVGIVARKNLTQSYAGAAERVVQYRLEFCSAAMIQNLILGFLKRKRKAKLLQRTRAAVRIQHVWRRILELKKQQKKQKKAEAIRIETLDKLLRLGATRSIQRSYRKYRHICYVREEERRQQEHDGLLQKARLKLLQRYQNWRKHSKRRENDQFSAVGEVLENNYQVDAEEMPDCKVATSCASTVKNEVTEAETLSGEAHQVILDGTEQSSAPIDTLQYKTDERLTDEETTEEDILPQLQSNEGTNQDEPESFLPQNDRDEVVSSSLSILKVDQLKIVTAVDSEPEDDTKSEENNEDTFKRGIPEVSTDPPSFESDLGQENQVETKEVVALAATLETTTIARATAAKRIVFFLLPKLQSRLAQKTHVAIRIQCLVRSYLAKKCMDRARLAALHSLRAQVLAVWLPAGELISKQNDGTAPNNSEDDFDSKLRENQSSLHTGLDNYIHVLPTRNGQIPPGVPVLQSSAGAPLLSLWKWNWPSEQWISNQ
ncbi:hypothetical protein P3T76_005664 [Phytophthora citrophthora]|uniref:Uncharacterized protein n=1 Tax=Phytophthora citrophthora TaxID=4793 RepID=A0AAD9LPU3_9STRA|nr:hypothetical protein P3T76_005664 [Phytophthora citrophthora]